MATSVKITGLKTLQTQLKNLPKVAKNELFEEFGDFARLTEEEAKQRAPVNEGNLRNAIKGEAFYKGNLVVAEISVNVPYAAYLEFGTRKFAAKYVATLPQDWQTFAAEFKGGGIGSIEKFLADLVQWVKDKGFAAYTTKSGNKSKSKNSQQAEESAAYIIARNILINGIKEKPYLFPAVQNQTPVLLDNLQKIKLA